LLNAKLNYLQFYDPTTTVLVDDGTDSEPEEIKPERKTESTLKRANGSTKAASVHTSQKVIFKILRQFKV